MTKSAIHLICGRDDGVSLNNLSHDKATKRDYCGNWDLAVTDADSLVDGWLYLHPSKGALSEFGGRVVGHRVIQDDSLAHEERVVFILEADQQGRGQRWRGQDHQRAWTGGVVVATLPHE